MKHVFKPVNDARKKLVGNMDKKAHYRVIQLKETIQHEPANDSLEDILPGLHHHKKVSGDILY